MTSRADSTTIRVGAVDNHPVVLAGIGAALASDAPDCELIAVAASVDDLLERVGGEVDVVLLDLGMPREGSVADDIRRLGEAGAAVLVFTSEERPVPLRQAVAAGAVGLILKIDPIDAIAATIRGARSGELVWSGRLAHALLTDDDLATQLTPRQVDILRSVSQGLPYKSVARALQISESTVREHLNRAVLTYRSRGIDPGNSHGLVRRAREEGHLAD